MKGVLVFLAIGLAIFVVSLELFSKALVKDPYPVATDSQGDYSSPEAALETYIWALNKREVTTYLECLGKNPTLISNTDMDLNTTLWGKISKYDIEKKEVRKDMVRLRVLQDFSSASALNYPNQRVDYYFLNIKGRWIYLPSGMTQTMLWLRNIMWSLVT